MNLTVDIGNTRTKWALFDGNHLADKGLGTPLPQADHTIYCTTGKLSPALQTALPPDALNFQQSILNARLPIQIDYATPNTLGPDRVAAACGAWELSKNCTSLIIDAGTCITIDLLDNSGTYRGGAILPGISMKFHALHTFTAKLPLLELQENDAPVTGRTTDESILAGVLTATRFAVQGFVDYYRTLHPRLQVFLTGGDAARLAMADSRVEPELVLWGLNSLLNHELRSKENIK